MNKSLKYLAPAVFAALMALCAVWDAEISRALINSGSPAGTAGNAAGFLPVALVGLFCAAALSVTSGDVFFRILWGFVCAGASFAAGFAPAHYTGGGAYAAGLCALALLTPAAFFVAAGLPESRRGAVRRAAAAGLLACVFALASVNLLKFLWGRPRPYMDDFSVWYIPQGIGRGPDYASFPSGHTANAALALWCVFIPDFAPGLKKSRPLIAAAAVCWAVFTAVSRVIYGDHYMSDVVMGLALGAASVAAGRAVFNPPRGSIES